MKGKGMHETLKKRIINTVDAGHIADAIQIAFDVIERNMTSRTESIYKCLDNARADRKDIRNKFNAHIKEHTPKQAYFVDPAKLSEAWTRIEPGAAIRVPSLKEMENYVEFDQHKEKMPPATLKALKESIRIWIRRAKGEQMPESCPLCRLLRKTTGDDDCSKCPVSQKTGRIDNGCLSSPWQKWYILPKRDTPEAQGYAYEEALFLFNLLPDEENMSEFAMFFLRKELEKSDGKR